jgi:hypothetical protein
VDSDLPSLAGWKLYPLLQINANTLASCDPQKCLGVSHEKFMIGELLTWLASNITITNTTAEFIANHT